MTQSVKTKVLVIGGGPGGYVAAIRCGQLGLETVLVEGDRLGGTCLIRGCIPSKAIIHAAGQYESMMQAAQAPNLGIRLDSPPQLNLAATMRWKASVVDRLNAGVRSLLSRANVRVVVGWAQFTDAKSCRVASAVGDMVISAEHVILATGSAPIELPVLPFGDRVISSTDALSLNELPPRLVVIGAGYVGLELGIALCKLGASVTVVDEKPQILSLYDAKLVQPVQHWLERSGVATHLAARVRGMNQEGTAVEVEATDGKRLSLPADRVLVTVGRRALTEGWGLGEMAIEMNGHFVRVDEHCATSTRNVWAIGDLVGEPMLAHKASAQGVMVAEIIAGRRRRFDPRAIPAVCFTEPEIVSVGLGPNAVSDTDAMVAEFPFQANGRALSMHAADTGGFVRVIARRSDHLILGIQAVGEHISELSGEFTHAIEMGAVLEDIAGTIHAHPTLGEAFHESTLTALGDAIHI